MKEDDLAVEILGNSLKFNASEMDSLVEFYKKRVDEKMKKDLTNVTWSSLSSLTHCSSPPNQAKIENGGSNIQSVNYVEKLYHLGLIMDWNK